MLTSILITFGTLIVCGFIFYCGYLTGGYIAMERAKKALKSYTDKVTQVLLDSVANAYSNKAAQNTEYTTKKEQAFKILNEVNDITQRQFEIMKAIDGPSKGAAFSRWRNDVIQELKQLEDDKIRKLKSILEMGLDPKISVLVDGVESKRRLSEVLAEYVSKDTTTVGTPTPTPDKKAKFQIIKNEE